jgi:hypothetical protein
VTDVTDVTDVAAERPQGPTLDVTGRRGAKVTSVTNQPTLMRPGDAVNRPAGERWTLTFELPADIRHGGRYMAVILKALWRRWCVRAVAVLEAPADPELEPNEGSTPHERSHHP